jgi:hypothetical protein
VRVSTNRCTEADIAAGTQKATSDGQDPCYSCQATELYDFAEPLAWWNPRQYYYDIRTRNHSTGRVVRVLVLSWLRQMLPRVPFGYRLFQRFHDWMHIKLTGRPAPNLTAYLQSGERTPTNRLNLKPGEYVRMKSQSDIEHTLINGKNRGLTFDAEEMAPYCGKIAKVRRVVDRIIDEPTGKMIYMKQPCIMLEGVVCGAEYASCRLNCPRAIPSYWRELWLERVSDPAAAGQDNVDDVRSADLCSEPPPAEALVGCEASEPTPSNCDVAG